MIHFKTIRWKNLLSTGNAWTEIDLSSHNTTLIVGKNGHGKSTILDALTFVLFGKPFRRINKPSLVNSINQRDCCAEIEFTTRGKEYKIVRGIKPNVFEIYCGGDLLDQTASVKDYQQYLEKTILQMNFKSFTQIVILGSAAFTPFMQLTPADRRVVIETILDIQIFSVMNVLAKQKFQENKELVEGNRLMLNSENEKEGYIRRTIASLKKTNTERIQGYRDRIEANEKLVSEHKSKISTLNLQYASITDDIEDISKHQSKLHKLINLEATIDKNLQSAEKSLHFYKDNDDCPRCGQELDPEFKVIEIQTYTDKKAEYESGLEKLKTAMEECNTHIQRVQKKMESANQIQNEIRNHQTQINILTKQINENEAYISKLENADELIIQNEIELDNTIKKIESLELEKKDLVEHRELIETTINLLKDGGIKTRIIRQYLPIINKTINKYLTQMGFFVDFNINENFEETIKSRYRDEFSYQNFSEGEKTRIDLAILFTWRAIAKMKNSTNTNLLILDEILDGSLDSSGTEEFIRIIKELTDGTNSFIISHKTDQILDKFDHVYRFEKVKNFSLVSED